MALLKRPELVRTWEILTMLWTSVLAWPARDQAAGFEPALDEYMFHHAMRAANGDASLPRIARFMAPPHHWFGRDVPGSRWSGDSPDFCYRTIPIEHGVRYELRGRPTCAKPPFSFYSLMADNTASPVTQALLESLDMDFASDGSFVVTIDDTPGSGPRNHLQTKPGADFLMIRDAFGDWIEQSPNALEIDRLDGGGVRRSEEDLARHCAKIALDGVYYTYFCMRSGNGQPPNTVRAPTSSAIFGGVATQWGTKGTIDLPQEDAIIVRANGAGANFRNLVLANDYYTTTDYWRRTSSLNMDQMAPDEDGNYTFVIAHDDPGIHNWLDTGGLRHLSLGHRWQAFSRSATTETPWMTTRQVRWDALARELPGGVRPISREGRQQQIAEREAGFATRFVDS